MDFNKRFQDLFPDAPAQDYSGETATVRGGGPFDLSAITFFPIASIPGTAIPDATWIDGGSAPLVSTPTRAVALIKTAAITTIGRERRDIGAGTMLVSITASGDEFLIRTQHINGEELLLPETIRRDELAATPEERALLTPLLLIDTLRTLAEHTLAARHTGIVILDGSLRHVDPYLRAQCQPRRGMNALAKTSALLTSHGRPLTAAVLARGPRSMWSALLDHTANTTAPKDNATKSMWCVKLSANASRAFLLETSADASVGGSARALLDLLAFWSRDSAFPGYPYPLVLADQFARVTNHEQEMWRAMLASDAKAAARLRSELPASDAHDVLEHILYGKRTF
jgi:hypothetical protein